MPICCRAQDKGNKLMKDVCKACFPEQYESKGDRKAELKGDTT
jgi:hypothetical protein